MATQDVGRPGETELSVGPDRHDVRDRRRVAGAVAACLLITGGAVPAVGQAGPDRSSVIDTVVIERFDVFRPEDAGGFPYTTMNALHVVTRPWVVRAELLLGRGERYDSLLARESERNLRNRAIFSEVSIDTLRLNDGRLAMRVVTDDAWSTKPRLGVSVAPDGTVTAIAGLTEANLVGTGILASAAYRRDVDREGGEFALSSTRTAGSALLVDGTLQTLSDQTIGLWQVGVPFHSSTDRLSLEVDGEAFDGRILQFRTEAGMPLDTTAFFRRALINRVTVGYAPVAAADRYLRVGMEAEVRREEYLRARDSAGTVPDSVYGQVGAFIEFRDLDYDVVRYFNGFAEEDVDHSESIRVGLTLAPAGWGTARGGLGPTVSGQIATITERALLRANVEANALWTSAGLDSGRVVASGTAAVKQALRHVSMLHVEGAVLDNPPPGGEIDLGFTTPPRLWAPHAFTGDRSLRASLEHRFYAWDSLGGLVAIGFAGFVDWGGAWYTDQPSRDGGNVGLSLLLGSPLGAVARVATLNVGYRFGADVSSDERWGVSFVGGLVF